MENRGGYYMALEEYRKDYLENVKTVAAAETDGTVTTFVKVTLENLLDAEIISDYELCYATGKNGRKMYRVDAYAFDDYDCSMSLFIADYSGENEIERLTKTDANTLFERLNTFLDGSSKDKFKYETEISTPAYDLVERLNQLSNVIRKFRFLILTDKEMSENISSFETSQINNIPIEYHIWDIRRLYRVLNTGDGHEPVEIDFTEITEKGIPCLEASDASTKDFKCYLCVLPGYILADLYDTYGSRLLEGNVRAFLSTKVAVNKNIRKTILGAEGENKEMFFSYNNGISATATSIAIDNTENGRYITSINNLQIVNGGQTTASLSNARYKDKADLSGIYVQMKLTVIPENNLAQILIPKISKSSNNQSKVSDADFFSNHEFNIRIQQISRRLYAPAVNGQQYETHWFFERSRGQYEQEQAKMTKTEQKKYQMQNPKDQKITKTDLAKIQNSWLGYPYYVSMGAQKNFTKFAEYIVNEWEKSDTKFNDIYYRDTIALAIIFKYIDKMVPRQDWYDKGYKANIVTYSMAFFHHSLKVQFPGMELNLKYIWEKQRLQEAMKFELTRIAKYIFQYITDETRAISNVTEWCKKEQCWIVLKSKKFLLRNEINECLIDKQDMKKEILDGIKEERENKGIEVQTEVIMKGQDYWERLLSWGKSQKLLNEIDISFLLAATKINYGRIPSERQCQRILNIKAKMIDEGFPG